MHTSPNGFHSQCSLLWLATNWPFQVFWTAVPAPNAPTPIQHHAHLCYPNAYRRNISKYTPSSGSGGNHLLKTGFLHEILDAYTPSFTLQTLDQARQQYATTTKGSLYSLVPASLDQVHEMTARSLQHAISWIAIYDVLMTDIPAIANSILQTTLPLFSYIPTTADMCYSTYSCKKDPQVSITLRLGPIGLPLIVLSTPVSSPTAMGTIFIGLPAPDQLQTCHWPTLRFVLVELQQQLENKGIHTILPF